MGKVDGHNIISVSFLMFWLLAVSESGLLVAIPITITCMAFSVPAFIHKGEFDVRIGRVHGLVSCRSAFLVAIDFRE